MFACEASHVRMNSSCSRVQEVMSHSKSPGTVMQTIGVGELLPCFDVPEVIDFMSLDVEVVWASQQFGELEGGGESGCETKFHRPAGVTLGLALVVARSS